MATKAFAAVKDGAITEITVVNNGPLGREEDIRDPHAEICGNCIFWWGGWCRRFPPQMLPYPSDNQHPIAYWPAPTWPSVTEKEWCGEWKGKP